MQITLFDMCNVLVKEDKTDGYIYLCPKCKTYTCGDYICTKCGNVLTWDKPRTLYTGKYFEQ